MKPCYSLLLLMSCWSCAQYGQLQPVASLPGKLDEVSGMVTFETGRVWVVEDSSNPDKVREIDTLGKEQAVFKVSDAKNRDWEALTRDSAGHLYIGDFGNNQNRRKNLRIYKLPDPRREKGDKIPARTIAFSYPTQRDFPPPDRELRYDAEALFHAGGQLYIITKNRSRPHDGTADVYRVPDAPGTYEAEWLGALSLCGEGRGRACQVTDAALSPDGERLVLLGYGTLWVFESFRASLFEEPGPEKLVPKVVSLGARTQLEALCFAGNDLLYLADERSAGAGGNLYRFRLEPDTWQDANK